MEMPKKTSITRLIIYAFATLLVLYVVQITFSVHGASNLVKLTRTIYDHPLVVSNASLKVHTNIIKMHRNMKDVVLFTDPGIIDTAIAEVKSLEQNTFEQLDIIDEKILGEKGKQLVAEALLLFKQWAPIRESVIATIQKGDRQQSARITRQEGAAHVEKLEIKMVELAEYARNKATGFLENIESVDQEMRWWSTIFLGLWVCLSLYIAFFTVNRTRRLERSAAEEKEKLQVTIHSIGDAVIVTDTSGKLTMINQVAEELTGWRESDALGADITGIFNIINETSRIPCENMIEKVLSENSIVGLANHTLLIAKDGTERAIADSGAPIRDDIGNITGVVLVFRDQTEEREVQKRLQDSEAQYRFLADNALDIIWTLNLDLTFTFVNKAIFKVTGFREDEWLGSSLADHCSEEVFHDMKKFLTTKLAQKDESESLLFETDWLKKNGEMVPLEIHGRVVHDQLGKPLCIQGVARDITERKKATEQRRYLANLLRQMGEIAKIGGWEFDTRTGLGSWTDEVAAIHDLDPAEKADMNLGLSFYHGEDRTKIEKAINESISDKKPYDLELQLTTAKGVQKWVRTIGVPYVIDDEVAQIRGSFQDITEQKRNENRIAHLNQVLRTIRDINQLIIRENDTEKLIQACSHILVDNRGYDCAIIVLTDEEDKPSKWGAAGIAENSQTLQNAIEQNVLPLCCRGNSLEDESFINQEGKNVCNICEAIDEDRDRAILRTRLGFEGTFYGYLVVALAEGLQVDAEERLLFLELAGDLAYALHVIGLQQAGIEGEANREHLEKQLVQSQKLESIGRLAGGVAHDFNNMLNVIMGFTELALEQVEAENPVVADLNEVMAAAGRAADITRQLLAFARKQTISPDLLDLNSTVEGLLKMLRRLIGEDIDLAWLPKPDLWIIRIDPGQLDQILANLCVNARDAIKGVGKITIETGNAVFDEEYCRNHVGFTPGKYVMLGVSDDGCGMDKETLANIFEPFYTTKSVGEGTGLGLSMVYGIVKQNEGFINVYSEVDKGTTIKIYLPRALKGTIAEGFPVPQSMPQGNGETILLVEDEIAILKLGEKMLKGLGYHVIAKETPEKALDIAREYQGKIHLLVTDVIMPRMNGRDLAKTLATIHDNIKVLYMSGYTANVIAHRGVLDEGVHFMPKPFSKETLALKVQEALKS